MGANNKKFLYSEIKEYFVKKGCKLLSKDYLGSNSPLTYICKCGSERKISFNKFRAQKHGCRVCAGLEKYTNEEVKKYFQDHECELLSLYTGANDLLQYKCQCGDISTTNFWNFRQGRRCVNCGLKKLKSQLKLDQSYVKSYFEDNGCQLLSIYENGHKPVEYICVCGNKNTISFFDFRTGKRCMHCAISRRTGENAWNWKGGITPLHNYLREKIRQWKIDSAISCNNKCVVTGIKFDVVHHLYSFNKIIRESLDCLNLPLLNVFADYRKEELSLIEAKCLELHYKYGLGVCLTNEVHNEFHSIYGYGDNTPEQFEEFKQNKLILAC